MRDQAGGSGSSLLFLALAYAVFLCLILLLAANTCNDFVLQDLPEANTGASLEGLGISDLEEMNVHTALLVDVTEPSRMVTVAYGVVTQNEVKRQKVIAAKLEELMADGTKTPVMVRMVYYPSTGRLRAFELKYLDGPRLPGTESVAFKLVASYEKDERRAAQKVQDELDLLRLREVSEEGTIDVRENRDKNGNVVSAAVFYHKQK